ncbi:MAG: hypothetical protein KDA51_10995 [Planctomycetales bacterium]|nr:hypothetical protein [Planctomycetales bacterium]
MSFQFDATTCQNTEQSPPIALASLPVETSPLADSIADEPPRVYEDDRPKYLRNGARIVSWDKGSNSVLCTDDGQWSVWLLDADGEPIRGSYFNSMSAAAYDYAERVMGYHPGVGDEELSDLED